MKGIILRHDGLFVLDGTVVNMEDDPNGGYRVTIRYEEYDAYEKKMVPETTEILFHNQTERRDGKPLVPYADLAREMKLEYGNAILVVVTFPGDSNAFAYGYRIKRSGIMSFKDEDGAWTSHVISGYVTKYAFDDVSGGVIFTVTAEPDKQGRPNRYDIVVSNNAEARKMLDALSPKGGTLVRAAFRCGPRGVSGPEKKPLFPCAAYDVMGKYSKKENRE